MKQQARFLMLSVADGLAESWYWRTSMLRQASKRNECVTQMGFPLRSPPSYAVHKDIQWVYWVCTLDIPKGYNHHHLAVALLSQPIFTRPGHMLRATGNCMRDAPCCAAWLFGTQGQGHEDEGSRVQLSREMRWFWILNEVPVFWCTNVQCVFGWERNLVLVLSHTFCPLHMWPKGAKGCAVAWNSPLMFLNMLNTRTILLAL